MIATQGIKTSHDSNGLVVKVPSKAIQIIGRYAIYTKIRSFGTRLISSLKTAHKVINSAAASVMYKIVIGN